MRFTRTKAAVAAVGLALTLAACGDDAGDAGHIDVDDIEQASNLSGTPAELADSGTIKIGVKMDQPGIGLEEPGVDMPSGFDIEMGRIVAARLGIPDDKIEWIETVSDNREPFLQQGTVDIVIASYSIIPERREIVGQAGPYYVTGQQLLVREDDKENITGPEDLSGIKVCSVEGSTSLQRVEDEHDAQPVPFATYSECVKNLENETVDAVTTDGAILLGYAAEDPDNLEVVGEPFSEERYGIGFQKGDTEMCEFLNETIQNAFEDGTWENAFETTLGQSGADTPDQPALDPCE